MINNMRREGINIFINDSWNPLSLDFLAANHIKLWIFDAKVAFIGGIGIESQFRKILFDEMDLISGPFVNVLTSIALLVMANQKIDLYFGNKFDKLFELNEIELRKSFFQPLKKKGEMSMKLAVNIPGYIQDSQKEYIDLLDNKYIQEIYLMAPYFSDDRVARTLIKTANKMKNDLCKRIENSVTYNSNITNKKEIKKTILLKLKEEKKIHILFPKKQENRIIEEISRYYAYYLRDNPIVETLQFSAKNEEKFFDMLHAKQLLVILYNSERKWKKYVKYCGSYNPAGRAHNMWELNALIYCGKWDTSDDDYDNSENLVKKYYEENIKFVFENYTEPFPWGSKQIKLNILERARMKLTQLLWF
jgi:phosphatidylserine/phosphatidylglycerophosphate/cardiolipin synthase-like enzyme